ncbi:acyl carrier protein [Candidatus Berkelbacteria bacterium]|nr:acyl carrier protein [Candidatus Berkelbacteria bacterium]
MAYLREHLLTSDQVITPATALFEEGILNSINILDLVGWVERELGRPLRDDEIVMRHFRTVRDVAALIEAGQQ